MDRIINVKVSGSRLTKDGNKAGTRGEANVTILRITFNDGWAGYTRHIVFWDAHGMNPTKISLLDNAETTNIFEVAIPPEAMGLAGELTFTIEGCKEGKTQIAVSAKLEVDDALIDRTVPIEPTPDQITQLNNQYESIRAEIGEAFVAKDEAKTHADIAVEHAGYAVASKNAALEYCLSAERTALLSQQAEWAAENSANRAENALGKTNYIGENGNWYAWDTNINDFYDTGVKAQSGSEVYLGDNPPDTADVWVNPNGGEYDIIKRLNELEAKLNSLKPRTVDVILPVSAWTDVDYEKYSQVVPIENVPLHCDVELRITEEQLEIFREKEITFWVGCDNGVVTVSCFGQKPTNDYEIQIKITEVTEDE